MARFFARFDSGSAGWESGFAAGLGASYFNQLRIAGSSASAALLRDGLITSRSLLSADIYADLDDVNEDGSKGTYFPPDLLTTDSSTYVSWSSAYTSSVEGIKTPTSNRYGTGDVNYSLRVTASILSSSNLVGRTTPIDPVGASYTTYINASNAVKAVLDVAQTGNGTLTTPYVRTGTNASRTLHSIWHDPDLQYFAWDDYTPGGPKLPQVNLSPGDPVTFEIRVGVTPPQYLNDRNATAPFGIYATVEPAFSEDCTGTGPIGVGSAVLDLQSGSSYLNGKAIVYGTSTGSSGTPITGPANLSGGGNSSWWWDAALEKLTWNIRTDGNNYSFLVTVYYHDAIIQTHVSGSDVAGDYCYPDPL